MAGGNRPTVHGETSEKSFKRRRREPIEIRPKAPLTPSPFPCNVVQLDNTYLFRASSLFPIFLQCLLSVMFPVTRVVARHALDTGSQSVMTVSLVGSPMLVRSQ